MQRLLERRARGRDLSDAFDLAEPREAVVSHGELRPFILEEVGGGLR